MILSLLMLVIMLFFSAFFSGAETAFMAVSSIKAHALVKQNKPGAQTLLALKERPRELIITILIGNNIVNIGASALATVIATDLFGSAGAGIATGIMTFIILIFGEITPKSYCTVHADTVALRLAKPIMFISKLLGPLVSFFEYMTTHIISFLGSKKKTALFSETELRTMVEVGVKEKRLEKTEKEFIEGVLEFNDITVKEVMTSKRRMFSLPEDITVDRAIKEIDKREYTRVPLYRGTKDKITGFITLKELLRLVAEGKMRTKVKTIARKPFFVDYNAVISGVFREFQKRHMHLAIVINKAGVVKGVVTLEDVLEEIVGEILDETDISPELLRRVNKKAIIVHGDTKIEDINSFFNVTIPHTTEIITLNQLLATQYKKKWQEGTKVKYNGLKFIVKQVEDNAPVHVMVEKK